METKYSYSDLSIVPAPVTNIKSRSECNPTYFENHLPIFTAPMESVCNEQNYHIFQKEGITSIIHRNVGILKRFELTKKGEWCAYSLSEFKQLFVDNNLDSNIVDYKALIDVANGHMKQIFDLAFAAKQKAKENGYVLTLMAGNIANPLTYIKYCEAGIDYVRCSIGTGSQCLTSANTAIHYPNASLIREIYKLKQERINQKIFTTKIIADGGMGNCEEAFSRSIIALGLGADYVMLGGAFASFLESAALITKGYYKNTYLLGFDLFCDTKEQKEFLTNKEISINNFGISEIISYQQLYNDNELAQFIINNWKLSKTSFGMSSKQAQENNPNFNGIYKTSEGKSLIIPVKYTCHGWVTNFKDYLKSTMSYCNTRTLKDFVGKQNFVIKSSGTMNSVNK